MTSKRNLEKRLERLEAQREMKRTAQESVSGEVDEVVVDAVIAFATHRLRGASDPLPADVVASLPDGFLEYYEAPNGDGGTSGRSPRP